MDDEGEQHIITDRARAAQTPHVVRYVLGGGLALLIIAYAVILLVAG